MLLIHALTGGRWGIADPAGHYVMGTSMLPLLLPAIVPILLLACPSLSLGTLRRRPSGQRVLPESRVRRGPLDRLPDRLVRDRRLASGAIAQRESLYPIAPAGVILLGLTANFAAIDALMSLDPHFNSSDFGMIFLAESTLFALSITIFATLLTGSVAPAERADRPASAKPVGALGVS